MLEVEHETRYGYAAPVTQAQHLAYLKPLHDARQQLLQHELQIEPAPLQLLHDTDTYGNARTLFSLNQPHRELRVRARSRVALSPRDRPIDAAALAALGSGARAAALRGRRPLRPGGGICPAVALRAAAAGAARLRARPASARTCRWRWVHST